MLSTDVKFILKVVTILFVIIIIVGYSVYQSKNLVTGPEINVYAPINGITTSNALVDIKGKARNISYISLNDRQIFIDKNGLFNEEQLLLPGYNVLKLSAKDRFGRNVIKKIQLIYENHSS